MKRSQKLRKILILVGIFIAMLVIIRTCGGDGGEENHIHHWSECDISEHEVSNFTDPEMDDDPTQDRVVIDFKPNLSDSTIQRIGGETGLDLEPTSYKGAIHNIYVATVPEGAVPEIHSHLMNHGEYARYINAVEEEFLLHTFSWEPDDPLYKFQWNMDQVGAQEAWTMSTGSNIVVAVIDTGVALDRDEDRHIIPVMDLEPTSRVAGYDFVDNSDFAWDGHGHGTHVAGTIAQATDNDYGLVGLAYNSTIMPVRVLDSNGSGTSAGVADGIRFAADNGANIINMSLGSGTASSIIQEAVTYARSKNVTIIAAAGNSGRRSPGYPAAFEEVIAVAATQYDKHPTFYSQYGDFITIAAPGGNTRIDQNGDGQPDGVMQETVKPKEPDHHFFGMFMGTSMASPHVAGIAALVQQWGVTHPAAVERILVKTTDTSMRRSDHAPPEGSADDDDDEDDPRSDLYSDEEFEDRYGAGIAQADSAVTSAILDPGMLRLILALIFSAFVFFVARGKSFLEADALTVSIFSGTSAIVASGLFLLPFFIPFMEIQAVASTVKVLATPVVRWDWAVLGMGQTPIVASFLIPLGLIALLHGVKLVRYAAIGVAVGFAGFCAAEMIMLTMPLLWIPGGDLAARFFYFVMASANLALAYFALKEKKRL